MDAKKVYSELDSYFIKPGITDNWMKYMGSVINFLSDNFKKRSMGVVCDNSKEINIVYSAVFPSEKVMQAIISEDAHDALLFVHHPMIWDIRKDPEIYLPMNKSLLEEFKKRRISIYNIHSALDNFGEYSTGNCLAEALGIVVEKPFCPYNGGLAGVIGKTKLKTVDQLKKEFEKLVGHKVALYNNGSKIIKNGKIAIIAGGGHGIDTLEYVPAEKVNVLVTGISIKNDFSKEAHEFDEKNEINVLGGTHYSTEKFACMKICNYFKKLGLPAKFIQDEPVLEDM